MRKYIEVEKFFANTIDKENAIIINMLQTFIKNEFTKQKDEIINNTDRNTDKVVNKVNESKQEILDSNIENTNNIRQDISQLVPKDVASLEVLSEITKQTFANSFSDEGFLEEKLFENECIQLTSKPITIEKMYIKPTLKLYTDAKLNVIVKILK